MPAAGCFPAEADRLERARTAVAERLGPEAVAAARRRAEAAPGRVVDAALAAIDRALGERMHPADTRSRSGARRSRAGGASLPLSGV